MTASPTHPSITTLAALALKKDLSLGRMSRDELFVTMACAALAIPVAQSLDEAQLNAALKTWLATGGSMLRIDHVELRRTLVDLGFLQRDPFGRNYQRAAQIDNPPAAQAIQELDGIDLAKIINQAREQQQQQREQRKARHQATLGNHQQ